MQLDKRCEMGGNRFCRKSYQIDRGRFENHLYAEVQKKGVDVLLASALDLQMQELSPPRAHSRHCQSSGDFRIWVFDASGLSLLKRHLGLPKTLP